MRYIHELQTPNHALTRHCTEGLANKTRDFLERPHSLPASSSRRSAAANLPRREAASVASGRATVRPEALLWLSQVLDVQVFRGEPAPFSHSRSGNGSLSHGQFCSSSATCCTNLLLVRRQSFQISVPVTRRGSGTPSSGRPSRETQFGFALHPPRQGPQLLAACSGRIGLRL